MSGKKKEAPRSGKRQQGFTLVEVMVALGILAFGILAIASMQVSGLAATTKANHVTQRTVVAMDRMEELMGMDYAAVQGQDGASTVQGIYTIATSVVPGPILNTLQVTVMVSALEKGLTRTSRLVCLRSQLT